MRFYTTERLGPKRTITPEGYLLCEEVPIARTGEMLYAAGELGDVEADQDGVIRVTRSAEDLFATSTIASFQGKPFTNDHPEEFVNLQSWREIAAGFGLNVRQDGDLLLSDIMVTCPVAIEAIGKGKREISIGYDADYDQSEPGKARQFNITGNHIALVEDGRCGPRCAIGDHAMRTTTTKTIPAKRMTALDRLMTAFKAKDETAFTRELEAAKDEFGVEDPDDKGGDTHVHVHVNGPAGESSSESKGDDEKTTDDEAEPEWHKPFSARLAALEEANKTRTGTEAATGAGEVNDEEIKPAEMKDEDRVDLGDVETGDEEPEDEKKGTTDSAGLQGAWRNAMSRAEILVPGVKLPTFDAKTPHADTTKALCLFRKRVLARALTLDAASPHVIKAYGGKPQVARMTCDAARVLFNAAAEGAKAANTTRTTTVDTRGGGGEAPKAVTPADINARNREYWANR
jgi:hypothetical protein